MDDLDQLIASTPAAAPPAPGGDDLDKLIDATPAAPQPSTARQPGMTVETLRHTLGQPVERPTPPDDLDKLIDSVPPAPTTVPFAPGVPPTYDNPAKQPGTAQLQRAGQTAHYYFPVEPHPMPEGGNSYLGYSKGLAYQIARQVDQDLGDAPAAERRAEFVRRFKEQVPGVDLGELTDSFPPSVDDNFVHQVKNEGLTPSQAIIRFPNRPESQFYDLMHPEDGPNPDSFGQYARPAQETAPVLPTDATGRPPWQPELDDAVLNRPPLPGFAKSFGADLAQLGVGVENRLGRAAAGVGDMITSASDAMGIRQALGWGPAQQQYADNQEIRDYWARQVQEHQGAYPGHPNPAIQFGEKAVDVALPIATFVTMGPVAGMTHGAFTGGGSVASDAFENLKKQGYDDETAHSIASLEGGGAAAINALSFKLLPVLKPIAGNSAGQIVRQVGSQAFTMFMAGASQSAIEQTADNLLRQAGENKPMPPVGEVVSDAVLNGSILSLLHTYNAVLDPYKVVRPTAKQYGLGEDTLPMLRRIQDLRFEVAAGNATPEEAVVAFRQTMGPGDYERLQQIMQRVYGDAAQEVAQVKPVQSQTTGSKPTAQAASSQPEPSRTDSEFASTPPQETAVQSQDHAPAGEQLGVRENLPVPPAAGDEAPAVQRPPVQPPAADVGIAPTEPGAGEPQRPGGITERGPGPVPEPVGSPPPAERPVSEPGQPERPALEPAPRGGGEIAGRPEADAGGVTGFTTSKGSTYTWDGTSSQRTKSPHEGHEADDVGIKRPSDRTVFVSPQLAQEIGQHLSLNSEAKPSVTIEGDKVVLAHWYGENYSARAPQRSYPFQTQPTVGMAPVEFWKNGSVHAGNPIVQLHGKESATPAQPPAGTMQPPATPPAGVPDANQQPDNAPGVQGDIRQGTPAPGEPAPGSVGPRGDGQLAPQQPDAGETPAGGKRVGGRGGRRAGGSQGPLRQPGGEGGTPAIRPGEGQAPAEGAVPAEPPREGVQPQPGAGGGAEPGRTGNRPPEGGKPAAEAAPAEKPKPPGSSKPVKRPAPPAPNDQGAAPLAQNHTIAEPDTFASGGLKSKFRWNVQAIETMRRIELENRAATPEEQQTLARYTGWGAMPGAFEGAGDWADEAKELKDLLTPDEHAAASHSTLNAHYTSGRLVQAVWSALQKMGYKGGGRVLEPSVGTGNFFGLMPPELREPAHLTGVELDPLTGRIAKLLYPKANIQIKGFQELKVPDNFFDVAVGNVPFGKYKPADRRYDKFAAPIHDYFFLKSIDQVRPGGVVAFITSTGTLDKADDDVRQELARKADLVAAIRLPGNAFLKNAGTSVVTDLVILRKRAPGEAPAHAAPWMGLKEVPDPNGGEPLAVNEYFADHPEQIMGTLDRTGTMYAGGMLNVTAGPDFEQRLAAAIERLPADAFRPASLRPDQVKPGVEMEGGKGGKQGAFVRKGGKLFTRNGDTLVPWTPKEGTDGAAAKKLAKLVEQHIAVRDALRKLLDAQLQERPAAETEAARRDLNEVYDGFVSKNGPLHKRANVQAFGEDPDHPLLLSLERKGPGNTWEKGDAFYKNTVRGGKLAASAGTPGEALGVTLNEIGRVDLERIGELLKVSPEDAGKRLAAAGLAFENPAGGWEPAAQYLSGNVKQKLLAAEAAADADPKYGPNVEHLKKVQPADVDYDRIAADLGTPWVPPSDIQQFAADLLGGLPEHFDVKYLPTTATWFADYTPTGARRHGGQPQDIEIYGTHDADFPTVLEHALNNKPIIIRKNIGTSREPQWVVLAEETAAAEGKRKDLEDRFRDWLWEDDARRQRLHRFYNDTYNNMAPAKWDGSHLTLPGSSPTIQLRPHQLDAVFRILSKGTAVLAHEVGTGKTYTMVAAAHELKRLGLARKPALVTTKDALPGFAMQARELYPQAKMLVVEKFDAKDRKRIISQIATGDWDMVLLTHDQLDLVPMSRDTQVQLLNEELEDLERVIRETVQEGGKSKEGNRLRKKLEAAKAKLAERIKGILAKPKDDAVTFEETGIDQLFVDEAHHYKSLPVYTKMDRVRGVPTGRSDTATMMSMRTRYLQQLNGRRGVVFATGTPVTNTLAEAFILQRYLQSPDLSERGLFAFDAWARNFARSVSKMEYKPDGSYDTVTRLSQFVNLKQLQDLTRDVIDFVSGEGTVKRPQRVDTVDEIPMTEQQAGYLKDLQTRAEAIKKRKGPPQKGEDNMLKLSSDARNSTLGMRLIGPEYDLSHGGKAERVAESVLQIWRDNPGKTQMVFADGGVNPNDWGYSFYQDLVDRLVAGGMPADKIIDFSKITDAQRRTAAQRLNNADALVAIGHSDRLGTGVNAQKHLIALHHADVPWTPAKLEQREGRIWRQGNTNPTIYIRRYVTQGSFDTFMWQALDNKTKFIKQFVTGDEVPDQMREDDAEELTPAQVMARASGDPRLLQKVQLEQDVAEMTRAEGRHRKQELSMRDQAAKLRERVAWYDAQIQALQGDAAKLDAWEDKDFSIEIGGQTYDDRTKATEALTKVWQDARVKRQEKAKLATFKGMPITLDMNSWDAKHDQLIINGEPNWKANVGIGSLEYETRPKTLRATADRYALEVKKNQADLEKLAKQTGKPFARAQELADKRKQLDELTASMKTPAKGAGGQQPPDQPPGAMASAGGEDNGDDDYQGWTQDENNGPLAALFAKKPPGPAPQRIPIDPLAGGKSKQLKDIIFEGGKGIGARVRRAKGEPGTTGVYYPGSRRTSIRYAGDLDNAAHELAHHLDDLYDVMGQFARAGGPSPFDAELIPQFSRFGSKPPKKLTKDQKLIYRRAEGFAEWLRAYLVNPQAAMTAAPQTSAFFIRTVPQEARDAMRSFGDDIRKHAGLPPTERALSNVRMDYPARGVIDRIRGMISGRGPLKFNVLDDLVTNLFDDLHPIAKAVRETGKMRDDLGDVVKGYSRADQLLDQIRTFAGGSKKFERILEDGPVKFETTLSSDPFEPADGVDGGATWLMGEDLLKGKTPAQVNRAHRDAAALLAAERVTEKAEQFVKKALALATSRVPSGTTLIQHLLADPKFARWFDRLMAKVNAHVGRLAGFGAGLERDDFLAQHVVNELKANPGREKVARELARRYRAWADSNLQYMLDGGRLTPEQVDGIRNGNQFYSDFHRVMDDEGFGGSNKLGSVRQPVHTFYGSTRQMENPFVNLLQQTARITHETDRNAVVRSLVDMLTSGRAMYEGEPRDLDAVGSRAKAGDEKAIKVFVGGKAQYWQFEPTIHRAMVSLGRIPELNGLQRTLSLVFKKLPQWAITHNPGFIFRQLFKDALNRGVISEVGSKPWDIFKPLPEGTSRNFELAGGSLVGGYMADAEEYHRYVEKVIEQLRNDKNTVLGVPKRAIRAVIPKDPFWEYGHGRGRKVEFAAAYKKALAMGLDPREAATFGAARSRDLADWSMAGRWVRSMSPYIPFLNPSFQGVSRMFRGARKNPYMMLAGLALFVIIPRLLTYAWNAMQGDDRLDEYRQLPAWRRDLNLNFKMGHRWVSIPTPYEFGVLGGGLERALESAAGNKHPYEGYAGSAGRSLSPVEDSTLAGPFKPVIEILANHDFFFDRNIIPDWEANKAVSLRDTSRASRLSKAFSMAANALGWETDPRNVDHFIYSMTGGLGWLAQDLSDVGRPDRTPSRFLQSGVGLFSPPPAGASMDLQYVSKKAQELGDENGPQVTGLHAALRRQQSAGDDSAKDVLARDVRQRAAYVRDFYDRHADELMDLRQAQFGNQPDQRSIKNALPADKGGVIQSIGEDRFGQEKGLEAVARAANRVRHAMEEVYDEPGLSPSTKAAELESLHVELSRILRREVPAVTGRPVPVSAGR